LTTRYTTEKRKWNGNGKWKIQNASNPGRGSCELGNKQGRMIFICLCLQIPSSPVARRRCCLGVAHFFDAIMQVK